MTKVILSILIGLMTIANGVTSTSTVPPIIRQLKSYCGSNFDFYRSSPKQEKLRDHIVEQHASEKAVSLKKEIKCELGSGSVGVLMGKEYISKLQNIIQELSQPFNIHSSVPDLSKAGIIYKIDISKCPSRPKNPPHHYPFIEVVMPVDWEESKSNPTTMFISRSITVDPDFRSAETAAPSSSSSAAGSQPPLLGAPPPRAKQSAAAPYPSSAAMMHPSTSAPATTMSSSSSQPPLRQQPAPHSTGGTSSAAGSQPPLIPTTTPRAKQRAAAPSPSQPLPTQSATKPPATQPPQ